MIPAVRVIVPALAATVIGCTGQSAPPSSTSTGGSPSAAPEILEISDYPSFIAALRGTGSVVREGRKPGLPLKLLDAEGQAVLLDGEAVWAFDYGTEAALNRARSVIPPRGDMIPSEGGGTAIINWEAPLFFGRGSLLVTYFGDDPTILVTLDRLLGKPFAGGSR